MVVFFLYIFHLIRIYLRDLIYLIHCYSIRNCHCHVWSGKFVDFYITVL